MKLNLILSVVFAATASMKESDTSSTSSSTLQAHNAASAAASSEVDLSIADSPLVHAISGGFGSAVSLLMFYPLDRVRVEMQSKVSSPIVSRGRQRKRISKDSLGRDETMTAVLEEECEMNNSEKESMMECFLDLKSKKELYSGVGPVMFSLAVSNFIFFYSHEAVKSMIINQKVKNAVIGAGKALLASTMAGAINVLLTNPLWVATLRIQLAGNENQENIGSRSQVKPGLFAMMTKIVKEEGILKLWSGTLTSLVLCSNPAIQLAFYERCKRNLLNIKRIKNQAISTDMVSLNLVEAFFRAAISLVV